MDTKGKRKIREQRELKVVKANALIQQSRFTLSVQEQKIVLYLISKIKPNDSEFQIYNFETNEFCKICGIDCDNGKNYQNIKDTVKRLADKSVWVKLENGKQTLFRWINKAWIVEQTGRMEIRLDDEMKPYLLELQKNFTQYGLIYILAMQSQYSIRLYELLKSYENLRRKTFYVDELKKMFVCEIESYNNFNNFKVKVLDIAVREINALTDINVEFVPIREGRKITQVEFIIKTKKETTERLKTFAEIEKLLDHDSKSEQPHD